MADRGRGLTDMLNICSNLFGKTQNIERHKKSLLLAVTHLPLHITLQALQKWIVKDTPPIMQHLADQLFIFDPLDRPLQGGWDRDTCLRHLDALPSIQDPSRIFQTVLTTQDEQKLIEISETIQQQITTALEQQDLPQAALRLNQLQKLQVIDHITVERILHRTLNQIHRHFQHITDNFKTHCHFHHFSAAQTLLQQLQQAQETFAPHLSIDLNALTHYYEQSQARAKQRIQREEAFQHQLKEARGRIEQLVELLKAQKETTEQQLADQHQEYQTLKTEMETQIQTAQTTYQTEQQALQTEMDTRLAQKLEALDAARALNQQELQQELTTQLATLKQDYAQKLETIEREKTQFLQEQQTQNAQRERELRAQREELLKKNRAIEAQLAANIAELRAPTLPKSAFGAADWKKYFGDIGEEPPLPKDIQEILNAPSPFSKGRRVVDDFTLTLVPQTINGEPLTLTRLGALIQHPKQGSATKYSRYYEMVKKELGDQRAPPAHWVLMTRAPLPSSESNGSEENRARMQQEAERTGVPYVVPPLLDAAVTVFMHHVKTGERLFSDSPATWTLCQERLKNGWPVGMGGFSAVGLDVSVGFGSSFAGVAALRKF